MGCAGWLFTSSKLALIHFKFIYRIFDSVIASY